MTLKQYKQKRDFKKTPELKAKLSKKKLSDKKIYTIQKHRASHLHYDLRLEMNGVLKSWAIPKEPPKVKGIKRLAVMTENHPLGYEKFSGIIPEGNYGAEIGRAHV